jgi:signal transduction histidine kinase
MPSLIPGDLSAWRDPVGVLFNRFARLPRDLASPVGGSGLGLYLCRVFAEAMGGTIRAESTGIEGEGSTFRLYLPLPSDAPPAGMPAVTAGAVTSDASD